mmetsp:Transcript_110859/g.207824  ORF Transcript_110859/g.207824 Transcript_110859/m.207824 type:complete len:329 (-) Transcript_110859:108-1094(-)
MVLRVCFMGGQPVDADLVDAETVSDVRQRVADVLGAPVERVELLDETGDQLEDELVVRHLGNAVIKTYVWGLEDIEIPEKVEHVFSQMEAFEGDSTTLEGSDNADSPGMSLPLHDAVNRGDYVAVKDILRDGVNVGQRDATGDTALHWAAYNSNKEIIDVLLEARSDPNAVDHKGKTPLRRAYDNKDVAGALIAAGADVKAADRSGSTTLHRAAEEGFLEVANLLLEARADANATNDEAYNALHLAAMNGHAKMAELLLSVKADINSRGAGGETPLHLAAYSRHPEACQVLVEAGANPQAENDEGETPIQQAGFGDGEVPEWILPRID